MATMTTQTTHKASPLVPEGYHRARAVQHDGQWARFGRTRAGEQRVLMLFEILDGNAAGRRLPWFGYITDAAWEQTIESLRCCGFEGDDLATLNHQRLDTEVAVKVEHDYSATNARCTARIAVVNAHRSSRERAGSTAAAPRHECHAEGCTLEIPARLLICRRHWAMVPFALQRGVWRHYRRGQEIDKRVTADYMAAAQAAIDAVAKREGRRS